MRSDALLSTTLGAICEQQGGTIQTGPFGSQLHASDYAASGTPVVMPADIVGGRVSTAAIARVGFEHVERLSQHQLHFNDIVFSRRGDVTRFARVTEREVGWLCGTGCLKVRMGTGTIALPEWISIALGAPEVKDWLVRHAVGATMPNLNTSILGAVPLRVPPIEQQREAVEVCFALDDRIDLLRQTNATLESIAQALFKSWFIDFDPVRAKAEGREPEGMDVATAALFPAEFEESALGLVPKGWEITKLGDHLELTKGCSYKGEGLSKADGAHMFNLGCFNAHRVFASEKVKRYTGEYRPRHAVVPGDLIMANTDMTQARDILGRPAFVPDGFEPGFISHHVFKVTMKTSGRDLGSALRLFLFFALQQDAFRERAIGFATGTTVLALPATTVTECPSSMPPDNVLLAFADAARPLLERIRLNEKHVDTLADVRDEMLPRLISGKLRLPGAQAQLEEAIA